MIAYVENLIESTENLLELLNEFKKTVGCKIKIQNQLYFYILTMKNPKLEFKKSFSNSTKNVKYLGKHSNQWRDRPCSWKTWYC